ncbi:NAD(P)-dependent alcohol dehydrogenase [Microbacterium sp.]|uniref:NAD(P)-dependent alcohol dehydrogenase n=1 Tax=Microbacterium sp. TaxID=51671 RepID=UPI003A8C4B1D
MTRSSVAAVCPDQSQDFVVENVTLDDPRAGEVQVRMVAVGVCHTDAVVRAGWIPTRFPIVLGHEGSGVVEKVGEGVHNLAVGDHVVLTVASCGECRSCWEGEPAYCLQTYAQNFAGGRPDGSQAFTGPDGQAITSHFFGQSSFASHANVAARSVVKVRDDVPLDLLGPLGCGLQTGAGAVLNHLQPRPDSTLVVFGAGAVGMSAIMAARVARVRTIVAVDLVDSRRALALELGATHAIDGAAADLLDQLLELSGGGVDYAIDTTAVPAVVEGMLAALGQRGHAVLVGAAAPDAEARLPLASALSRAITITTVIEGSAVPPEFIPELLELYLGGEFPIDRLMQTYAFHEINTAFADSDAGHTVKPVLIFDQS